MDARELRHPTSRLSTPLTTIITPLVNTTIKYLLQRTPARTQLQALRFRLHPALDTRASQVLQAARPPTALAQQSGTRRVQRLSHRRRPRSLLLQLVRAENVSVLQEGLC
jgi:hypothetical protein